MKIYFNKPFAVYPIGIKCDNPECDFRDDSVKCENYQQWLNKPCPKCGQNLLTQKDYDTVQHVKKIEQKLSWLKLPSFSPPKEIHTEMNGSGKIHYRPKPSYVGIIASLFWLICFGFFVYTLMYDERYILACLFILFYNFEMRILYDRMYNMKVWKITKDILTITGKSDTVAS